ncbi:MAG: type I restriction endonuclease subunit R [Acidimicrobiia bacterium]|nr:type I restriction endonuclease subunit R [Acidimicrobiia bacterium]
MFDEANSVEAMVLDRMTRLGWTYIRGPSLERSTSDVLLESVLTGALIRLNPAIAAQPERADEVIYKLRAMVSGVLGGGLVGANEEFMSWVRGERTMPFGPSNEHVTIRLIDFDLAELETNSFIVSNQVTFTTGPEKRFDVVGFVNGLPMVLGEAKSPVRKAVTWVDGAAQVYDDYEVNAPAFFVPNAFSFATDGKDFRFGSIQLPVYHWAPWRLEEEGEYGLHEVDRAVSSMLRPAVVLDIAQNFSVFATDRNHRKIKVICRFQQYEAANKIVRRVVGGRIRKGLIWHFQGSGKSLLMVFAANKLRQHEELGNPTVVIVVDRIDLDTQITATFNAADVSNMVTADSRRELHNLLARDARKVIITTVHKFAEAGGVLNDRDNIVVLVDEAHRTQEGDLGRQMRNALPNAFLFGLTGTPINTRDRNTFYAFGAIEDPGGYLDRYSFEESIRDDATLPLRFETRSVDLRIDRAALDKEFEELTRNVSDEDRAEVSRRAGRFALLVKAPARVEAVISDIRAHFLARVAPEGFGAMIVTVDQEACVLYKDSLDALADDELPAEASEVVMNLGHGAPQTWRTRFGWSKDEEAALLDRFRDPADPLKILIVTAKLLTGFDAPNLQCMYLDRSLRDHNLLQAICRTNRVAPGKSHGLIVDYLGLFDDVAQALAFDEASIDKVISNIDDLKEELGPAMARCLQWFEGVDRGDCSWEGLLAAQECLPDTNRRDEFAADFSALSRLWEALSPDPLLVPIENDYRWLAQVYDSLKPPSGNGKLLWHALGAKTIELIHRNISVQTVRDDLDTLVMDAEVLEGLLEDPERNTVEIEIKIATRLRRHSDNPKFVALSERLESLRLKHEQGLLASVEFLKQLIDLAKDVVQAEREEPEELQEDVGQAALTELFEEVKNTNTPVIVDRIVAEIDSIVRQVRFPGWQRTDAGEREVRKALRRSLLKYKLHTDQDLFDRAYAYIARYY